MLNFGKTDGRRIVIGIGIIAVDFQQWQSFVQFKINLTLLKSICKPFYYDKMLNLPVIFGKLLVTFDSIFRYIWWWNLRLPE